MKSKEPVKKVQTSRKKITAQQPQELSLLKKKVVEKKLPYLFTVGRRKEAVARVRLYPKDNRNLLQINNKDYKEYFPYFEFQKEVENPLNITGNLGKYFISVKVSGGGRHGQAEAVRHGLARVLVKLNENNKKSLKAAGILTRDPREKERKKPGLKRARRAPQWQKR